MYVQNNFVNSGQNLQILFLTGWEEKAEENAFYKQNWLFQYGLDKQLASGRNLISV